ncbi:MAG: hypothetical protein JNJ57_11035 [Saprospiraceae bacterium]|nr:hypothetical protein [Saprospiraceae bacterium]
MMPKQNLLFASLLILSAVFQYSCSKSEYEDAKLGNHTADFAFPLFTTDFKLKDLLVNVLNDSLSGDTIFINPDNSMTLYYTGDVAKKPASDLFPQLIGGFPITDSIFSNPIPGPAGVKITRADLTQGNMYFVMKNFLADSIRGYFEIPQMTNMNGQVFTTSEFILAPGESWNSGIIDLAGMHLESATSQLTFRYYAYTPNGVRVRVPSSGWDIAVFFGNLKFKYVEGNWGNQEYQLTRDTIEIDINQTELKGDIKVTNPQVTMRIVNSWGFPTRGVIKFLSFIGQNGEEIPLISTVFQQDGNGNNYIDFAYPSITAGEVGQTKYTDVYLDNTNSNIADIFNSQPTRLIYEVDGISNAASDPNLVGFITDESIISLQMQVEMLLEGSAKNFGAEQELELDFEDLGSLDSANIESVEFKLVTENQMPIDIHAQIFFRDAAGVEVDSLFDGGYSRIMRSAPVSNGVSSGTTRTETFIPMSAERFDRIRSVTQSALLKVFFTTAEEGQIPVKFLADNGTVLKMGIRVKKTIE